MSPQSEGRASRLARVAAVVRLGRRLSEPDDALGREARAIVVASSGLSKQGVELALAEHVEVSPREADLQSLVDLFTGPEGALRGGASSRCWVVLSSTVPVAIVRAVALSTAACPATLLRPSRRDPALAHLVARALNADARLADAGGTVQVAPTLAPSSGDAVHAYGSDTALGAIHDTLPEGVKFWGHGHGFGVAVVSAADDPTHAAQAIARDVVVFDQTGCLSPRVALVSGGVEHARAFATALRQALLALGESVPRGPGTDAAAAEEARYVEAMRAVGEVSGSSGALVGFDDDPVDILLPPASRAVHVVATDAARVAALLGPHARFVAAIGADAESELARAAFSACPGARVSRLGQMQRPPLDGPVDRRALLPLR